MRDGLDGWRRPASVRPHADVSRAIGAVVRMKAGDPVEVIYADGGRTLGVIQDVAADVVTVVLASAEGETSAMVRPDRLKAMESGWWRIEM